jgi:hypothetical protein
MRNSSWIVCALSPMAVAGVASANQYDVGILSALGNTSWDNDVLNTIKVNAPFLNVHPVIDVDTSTPDMTTLNGFQSIIVIGNNPFANSVTLGDKLQTYISEGQNHGVVIAAWGNVNTTGCPATGSNQICGGFNTADDWAIEPGSPTSGGGPYTLGTIYVPGSPLLAGVASFSGGTRSSRVTGPGVNTNATRIADWSDGTPLIAERTFGSTTEIALNFFPVSSATLTGGWLTSTNGAQLITNALLTAGNITYGGDSSDVPEAPTYLIAGTGICLLSLLRWRRARA